jgi:hypothetical protein
MQPAVVKLFSNSLMFFNACGGHLQKGLDDFRAARSGLLLIRQIQFLTSNSFPFTSAFAFGAPTIDPLFTAIHFISVVLEHHIFSDESAIKVAERGARGVLTHSSVYLAHGSIYCLQDAAIRYRPNGEEIRCHRQPAKYVGKCKIAGDDAVIFRCSQPDHDSSSPHGRKFVVKLLRNVSNLRRFVGHQPRIMITVI